MRKYTLIVGFCLVLFIILGSFWYVISYGSISRFIGFPSFLTQKAIQNHTKPMFTQDVLADTSLQNIKTDANFSVSSSSSGILDMTRGSGISVTAGQHPVITNTGVLSFQDKTGVLFLANGNGISISGLTITNSDPGSSQNIFKNIAVSGQGTITTNNNNDTLTFSPGFGLSVTTDQTNKKITISQTLTSSLSALTLIATDGNNNLTSLQAGSSGYLLQSNGSNASPSWISPSTLSTSTLSFSAITSGLSTQSAFIIGNGSSLTLSGTGTINASTLLGNNWNSPGTIGLTTPNTATFTTLSATGLTVSGLNGIAHISNTGVFSSSAVNVASSDVSGILPIANGGTGISSFTQGDIAYFSSGSTLSKLGIGSNNSVLTSNGTIPQWSNSLTLSGLTVNGNIGLGTSSPGVNLDIVGGGIRADSPARIGTGTGYHTFEGNYTSGTAGNYLGSGVSAGLNNLIGTSDMHAGFGVFIGNNIASPSIWMYTAASNAFDVRKVNYNQDPSLGTSLFVVRSSGNVGINTISPNFRLDVEDSQTSSAAAQIFNTNTSSTATGLVIKLGNTSSSLSSNNHFISFESSGIGIVGSVEGNGANGITFKQSGIADFAEYFAKDPTVTIPFGSLVCMNTAGTVSLCDKFHTLVTGIASEHPAFLGGADQGNASVPIGLTGLVKTRVSSQNGTISPGDMITVSSIPGVGVKALGPGEVIGQAVNSYTNADPNVEGTVLVSVHNSWYAPSQTQLFSSDLFQNETDATISGQLSVTGRTELSDVGITGKLQSGLLTLNGLDTAASAAATINTLSGPLKLQSLALGGLDFLNGKVLIDTDGTVHLTNSITAEKYNLSPESHALGEAEIPSGQSTLDVKTDAVTNNSRVFITAETVIDVPIAVTQKKTGNSFTVVLPKPTNTPIKFSWWIVN